MNLPYLLKSNLKIKQVYKLLKIFAPCSRSLDLDSRPSSPNLTELNSSLVSRTKHVHFAPDLDSILLSLDEEGVVGFLQQQRDVSADIKRELEHSLRRLRDEAHELLQLSARCSREYWCRCCTSS